MSKINHATRRQKRERNRGIVQLRVWKRSTSFTTGSPKRERERESLFFVLIPHLALFQLFSKELQNPAYSTGRQLMRFKVCFMLSAHKKEREREPERELKI